MIGAQPASPEGYVLRAAARISPRDQAGGEADLQKAIRVAPQNPTGYYLRLGGLRLAQKRYNEAAQLFEQAFECNPDFVEALQGLVNVYAEQKQPAKAVSRVNAQIARSPGNGTHDSLLGKLLATCQASASPAPCNPEKALRTNGMVLDG